MKRLNPYSLPNSAQLHRVFVVILLISATHSLFGQQTASDSSKTRLVAIGSPSAKKVNGLMLTFGLDDAIRDVDTIYPCITNGLYVNLNPFGPIFGPIALFTIPLSSKSRLPPSDTVQYAFHPQYQEINGLQVALHSVKPARVTGVEIHLVGSHHNVVKGVSIGGIASKRESLNGVGIAPLGNFDTEVRGVQIGLWNTTYDLRGIQIGLWNKNQRRVSCTNYQLELQEMIVLFFSPHQRNDRDIGESYKQRLRIIGKGSLAC